MKLFSFFILFFVVSFSVHAQIDDVINTDFVVETGPPVSNKIIRSPVNPIASSNPVNNSKYSKQPLCGTVRNMASYGVLGTVSTDYEVLSNGSKVRHQSNFRLDAGKFAEFCTKGPFYEGGRIDITLRTLVPIFSCRTKFDKEIIVLGSKRVDGTYDTRIICE